MSAQASITGSGAAPDASADSQDDTLRSLHALRQRIRSGAHTDHTSGFAPGFAQGNVVIMPETAAGEFLRFCQRNPRPCPLLAVSDPGDPMLPELGRDIDIRTDVPRYRVFRHGRSVDKPTDIRQLWQDDWVTFILGCSFTFEEALIDAGIPLRHVAQGRNVAMYSTSIPTRPAGRFSGPLVVSMRPMKAADAIRAVRITAQFSTSHGAPVHLGDPKLIGIERIEDPDWGDPVTINKDELPVFWACGVTPQTVIQQADLDVCITHDPGCMLVTDVRHTITDTF
ncbi:MAG TPA: putative hydro-lyase [Gammaproteobacteria bacterium]|nr:putative hydro-lyase [Gammaproteobacteria bacterium]